MKRATVHKRAEHAFWGLIALCLGLSATRAEAQTRYPAETFDSWPAVDWGTYTNAGWVVHDGKTRGNPLVQPFSSPIAVWLRDYDYGSNSWLRSDWFAQGVGQVQFRLENYSYTPGTSCSLVVEKSTNGTDWTTSESITHTTVPGALWPQYTVAVGTYAPTLLRWRKTGENPIAAYVELGVDSVEAAIPDAVSLANARLSPSTPTTLDNIHGRVDLAGAHPNVSNITVTLFYRIGGQGPYASREMAHAGGATWQTLNPIPPGASGLLEYYVRVDADLGGQTAVVFEPDTAPSIPNSTTLSGAATPADRRQLAAASHASQLTISEIHYHPRNRQDGLNLEFVELRNTAPVESDLGGFRLSGEVDYTFPAGTVIAGESTIVVAADPAAIAGLHPITYVLGPYEGGLANGGGVLRLRNRSGAVLQEVEYSDRPPWPAQADGGGHSLVLARPDYGENDVRAWRASDRIDGSPGKADYWSSDALTHVRINEFMTHTDLPQLDFVELYNHGGSAVSLGGCVITDDPDTQKFIIPPATSLPGGGYLSFNQDQLGFLLRMEGGDILLIDTNGNRVIDAVRYDAQIRHTATGRLPNGSDGLRVLASPTPGAANRALADRAVVINEIMFHPLSADDRDEYLELHNRSASPVDLGYWRFTDGIDYMIPSGTVIEAGGYLVVARDAARMIAHYPQLNTTNTVGNFSGQLSDRGERIVLSRPDDLALPYQDYVVMDTVEYGDGWARWTDGGGSSLELTDPRSDNRLAMNWAGSDETQKAPWTLIEATDVLSGGLDTIAQLQFFLQRAGECLVDDIEIETGGTPNLAVNFESGAGSLSTWGTHSRTSLETSEGYGTSAQSLHIRASDRGDLKYPGRNEFMNHLAYALNPAPAIGSTTTIRAKARWLCGSPMLILNLHLGWMEAAPRLETPVDLGTPGLPNSRLVGNAGPAIHNITQAPVLPAAGESVTISAHVHDPDGVNQVQLKYRVDPATTFTTVTMNDSGTAGDALAGDGIFSARIPGQSSGTLVAFRIEASDSATMPGGYPGEAPDGAPPLECLVRFGFSVPDNAFGAYSMWLSEINRTRWRNLTGESNEPIDLTLVIGNYRAIYNAGGRFRGLHRQGSLYPEQSSHGFSLTIPKSERVLGETEVKLDPCGQGGGDQTRQLEHHILWMAREVDIAASQIRFVQVRCNGTLRGTMHDLQTATQELASRWFGDPDPAIFKHVLEEPFVRHERPNGELNQGRYRYHLRKTKPRVINDDYSSVYGFINALTNTSTAVLEARVGAIADVRSWASYFATACITGNIDIYGRSWWHNAYYYFPADDRSRAFMADMDLALRTSASDSLMIPGGQVCNIMFNVPAFRREYWRYIREFAEGPLRADKTDDFLDAWYAAFTANGVSVTIPNDIKSWYKARRSYLLGSQLPTVDADFEITSNGGNDFATAQSSTLLAGSAPVEVATFNVNGTPHKAGFTSVTGWTLDIALGPGVNPLLVEGLDRSGNVVTSETITVTSTANAVSPAGQLVINEIQYHPTGGGTEFIEIHNRSATTRFHVGGMRINGIDFTFPMGTYIEPQGFLLAVENLATYQYTHGNAEVVAGEYDGSLDNGGETLSLWMPASPATPDAFSTVDDTSTNWWVVIDSVRYDDDAPWPTEADGFGPSLQLVDASRDNSRPGNWASTPSSIEAKWIKVSVTVTPPAVPWMFKPGLHLYLDGAGSVLIDDISLVDESNPGVNLVANGDFESPLSGTWTLGTGYDGSVIHTGAAHGGSQCLQLVGTQAGSPTLFLPASVYQSMTLTAGTSYTLSFWYLQTHADLTVTLERPGTTLTASQWVFFDPAPGIVSTPGAPNNVIDSLPPFPELWINEIMPSNVVTRYDSANEFDPWIELYNSGATPIDLGSGYYLSNDPHDTTLWTFPAGWSIGAGERLLVWADAQPLQTANYTELHAGFRLDGHTGTVVLAYDTGSQARVLDSIDYAFVGADYSYGSATEGDPGSRVIFHYPTPGASNSIVSQPVQLTINEWMADNVSTLNDPADLPDLDYEDWFEIHNAGSTAVNLGGYTLTDDLSAPAQYTVPNGTYVPAGGFLLVWADGETGQNGATGDLHVNFKLSAANGESIGLFAPDGSLVDAVTFGPQLTDISEGRWRDGASFITQMGPPTPRAANRVLMVTGVQKAGGGMTLTWSAAPGTVYRIEAHSNLVETSPWTPMGLVTAQTGVAVFTDQATPAPHRRFYRIIIE